MVAVRAMAGLMTALVVFAFRHDGAPLIWYGLVGVTGVAGNLGGAAVAPTVRRWAAEERIVAACALVIAAAAVGATQLRVLHRWPAALLLVLTVSLGASIAKVAFDSVVQRDAPERTRSRTIARFETVFQLGWVAGALVPTLFGMSLLIGFVVVSVVSLAGSAGALSGLRGPAGPPRGDPPERSVSARRWVASHVPGLRA
jgi:hypothetical protein